MPAARRSITLTLMPLLAVMVALLGDPISEAGQSTSCDRSGFVVRVAGSPPAEVTASPQPGLPAGAMPAPRTGRLRVREADRLGPGRLHLPPPTA
ncbi:MAG: hypothetical protein QF733_02175 [Phycisphaerales bacterium]|nr:hypothetical protein [Phycisphaerales bacterium]